MNKLILFLLLWATQAGAITTNSFVLGGQLAQVLLPDGYSTSQKYHVLVYCHGLGEYENAPLADTNKAGLMLGILSNGWLVASSTAHYDTGFGNQASLNDYRLLIDYALTNYSTSGKVVILSQSMGGLPGLLTAAARSTNIVGWLGVYPICSMADAYSVGFGGLIQESYGFSNSADYATATTGHDPLLLPAATWAGLPMRFYASYGDTVVPRSQNTDLMSAQVSGYASEFTVMTCTGEHGDYSCFQTSDVLAFLARTVSGKTAATVSIGVLKVGSIHMAQ